MQHFADANIFAFVFKVYAIGMKPALRFTVKTVV